MPSLWCLREMPSLWRLREMPSLWRLREMPSLWRLRDVLSPSLYGAPSAMPFADDQASQKGRAADLAGLAGKMAQFFEGIRLTEAELRAAAAGGEAAAVALLRERTEEALDRREVGRYDI
jgi:hypothetical protein